MNFIWKYFGLAWIKKQLDKIPGSGKKTAVGAIIMLLTVASGFIPAEYQSLVKTTLAFLRDNFASQPVMTAGAITTAIGILHKILKALEALVPETPSP